MFLPPSALRVYWFGVRDASGMEEVCKPFPSINFLHLPALAPEAPESPRISWHYGPLPTPIPAFLQDSLVWRGHLHLSGQIPSGDQASSEGELGCQLMLGPSETAQSSCLAPENPLPIPPAGWACGGCLLSQGGIRSACRSPHPFLSWLI